MLGILCIGEFILKQTFTVYSSNNTIGHRHNDNQDLPLTLTIT